MCGIVGIIGPNAPKDVVDEVFTSLLVETQKRGDHATGVAATRADGGPLLHDRRAMKSSEYVKTEEYKEILRQFDGGVIIGHCRKTTKGSEKNNLNNHPLISPNTGLGLIHNGTVEDDPWRVVDEDGKNPYIYGEYEAEVDTEVILRLVETMLMIPREEDGTIDPQRVADTPKENWKIEVDLNTAIRDAAFNINGKMSCALLDPNEPNRIRLWRVGKPCEVAYIPEYEMIVFASEKVILEKALTDWDYNFVLGYFPDYENIFPEWLHTSTTENRLTDIEWTGDEREPFNIVEQKIHPGEANAFRSSIEAGKDVSAGNKKNVQVH